MASRYTTSFNENETPLSEGGAWITGNDPLQTQVNAVTSSSGIAFGTQTGNEAAGGNFNDSEAYLSRIYANNQRCSAVVHKTGVGIGGGSFQEIELLLRWRVGALRTGLAFGDTHSYGYEINMAWDGAYVQIGRFKETPALFDSNISGSPLIAMGVNDGDEFIAEMIGNTITVWINRAGTKTQIAQGTDGTGNAFVNGSPGIGFFMDNNGGGTTNAQSACWASFQASEVTVDVGQHGTKAARIAVSTVTSDPVTTQVSGSSFFVAVGWTNAIADLTSVTDNQTGNVYTQIGPKVDSGLGYFSALFYVQNGNGGAGHTFTANFSPAVDDGTIFFVEVTGGSTTNILDRHPPGRFTTVSPYLSYFTGQISQPDELLLSFVFTGTASGTETITWQNSFLQLDEISDTNFVTGASAKLAVAQFDTYQSSITSSGAGTTNAINMIVSLRSPDPGGAAASVEAYTYVTP